MLVEPTSFGTRGSEVQNPTATCGSRASCGPSLREKVIDVSRGLSKSALSLQVRAGRSDSIIFGIENSDLVTLVALVVKDKFVSVILMCAGCHPNYCVLKVTTFLPAIMSKRSAQ
jgi:hypothetical protein